MYAFDLHRPTNLDEALALMAQEDSLALSGGQTLIPSLKSRLVAPARLVSLTGIDALRGITRTAPDRLTIGAAMRHAEVAREVAGIYPALAGLAGGIGDPSVRNRGTIGGSLANNDPSACYPAGALASRAVITTDRREIAADDYFIDLFTTALDEGEIVTAVTVALPLRAHYIKFRQIASGFALVGVCYARYADGCRIAVTGAGQSGVFRWRAAEEAVESGGVAALQALPPPDVAMMSDIHADATYRAAIVAEITRRCVLAAES